MKNDWTNGWTTERTIIKQRIIRAILLPIHRRRNQPEVTLRGWRHVEIQWLTRLPPHPLTFHALHGGRTVVTGRGGGSSCGGLVVPVEEAVGGPLRWHCRGGRVSTRQKHGIQGSRHDGGDTEGVGSWRQRVGQFHRVRASLAPPCATL